MTKRHLSRLAPALLLLSIACASLAPGSDPVVVQAERTWQIGFATVNSFLKVEDAVRRAAGDVGVLSFLQTPAVHEFAETLRRKVNPKTGEPIPERFGKYAFDKLDEAIQAYKANRTPEGKANVQTWLALALELVQTAQEFMGGKDVADLFEKADTVYLVRGVSSAEVLARLTTELGVLPLADGPMRDGYQDAGASRAAGGSR